MFNLSYSSPCEIQGEIVLKKWPGSLGDYKDVVTGQIWNIIGIFGSRDENDELGYWVQAVPMGQLHPYYRSTALESWGSVSQRWLPYKVVLQDERNVEAISTSSD
jgi:hypothetical protein